MGEEKINNWPISVLVLSNAYPSAEKSYAGVFVLNQVRALTKDSRFSCHIHALRRKETGVIGSLLKYAFFAISSIKFLFVRFDVVHVHFFYPVIFLGALFKLINPASRLVVTIHGSDVRRNARGSIKTAILRLIVRHIDRVICVGPSLAAEFSQLYARPVDLIMPAGIDESIFKRTRPVSAARSVNFVYVGSLLPVKGFDIFIEALRTFSDTDLSVVIIGSGPMKPLLQNVPSNIKLRHHASLSQAEIADVLNKSSFLVLPSRNDSFGLVVTEALFCGCPAIVSTCDGPSSQIAHGENGFIFPMGDAAALAAVMRRASLMPKDDYQQMATRAMYSNVEYRLSSVMAKTKRLYGLG